ncbi:MAG: sigma-70 family RNA polymerase sigma factor [Nocardioidaceae bacterium]|nr:sigma-70 family RNA polymerase sigma factor [Nocardioidaceae bacterium]
MTPNRRASLSLTGYAALRLAVTDVLPVPTVLAPAGSAPRESPTWPRPSDGSPRSDSESTRLVALVDLARQGDSEAFGALYDHYSPAVYRFISYRVGVPVLAEDLTSETFFRALRSINDFRWQGKNFGAWLMTIARNLVADHYKSSRTRLEVATDDFTGHDEATTTPEDEVQEMMYSILHKALARLPADQQECLVLRFLNGNSIQQTAEALSRSEGAVKQLQLRAVRNLAKLLPEGFGLTPDNGSGPNQRLS